MVQYIFRNHNAGYSIAKVFNTFLPYIGNKNKLELPYAGADPISVIRNLLFLIRNKQKDVLYHITGNVEYCALVLPPNRTILTIHDLVLINHNKYGWFKKLMFYYLWHYLPIKRARLVTCISLNTKNELLRFFPWSKDKIVVIPNPVDPEIVSKEKVFNADCPTILHIGTRENKNLERVAEALQGVSCKLRIIGELTDLQKEFLSNYHISYEAVCNLSDSEIRCEYNQCDIVSFPSTYEGFGMPIIEGYAAGRIVVTSNLSPMNVLAEDGAILVNPFDVKSIRQGFLSAIDDAQGRNEKVKRGLEIVKKYSAENIARQYEEAYADIL